MGRKYNTTNLSDLNLGNIEFHLNEGKNPTEIARILGRDKSTIRKEIKKYSSFVGMARKCGNCLDKDNCREKFLCDIISNRIRCSSCKNCSFAPKICPSYKTTVDCELLKKNHHVCNGCKFIYKCKKVKIKYIANSAIKKHKLVQKVSRKDLKFDSFPKEFRDYISSRVKLGHSPEVILNTLPEKFGCFNISIPTLYDYIDKGLLDCCNLDLRNKVSRIRYGTSTVKRNTVRSHQLNGRSIEDLDKLIKEITPLGYFEMDCVEGIEDGSFLLTLLIPKFSLLLAFKIDNKTQEEVKNKLDELEDRLDCYFYVMFNQGVTDNGSEFLNFDYLETSIHSTENNYKKRLSIYYAHAYCSTDKAFVENGHIILRWLLRKGYDITLLSDDDILDIINRLNNYPRKKLGFKTPLQALEEELGDYVLELLDLQHIPVDYVNMKDILPYTSKKEDI